MIEIYIKSDQLSNQDPSIGYAAFHEVKTNNFIIIIINHMYKVIATQSNKTLIMTMTTTESSLRCS